MYACYHAHRTYSGMMQHSVIHVCDRGLGLGTAGDGVHLSA